jgi:hypothetical protein
LGEGGEGEEKALQKNVSKEGEGEGEWGGEWRWCGRRGTGTEQRASKGKCASKTVPDKQNKTDPDNTWLRAQLTFRF